MSIKKCPMAEMTYSQDLLHHVPHKLHQRFTVRAEELTCCQAELKQAQNAKSAVWDGLLFTGQFESMAVLTT